MIKALSDSIAMRDIDCSDVAEVIGTSSKVFKAMLREDIPFTVPAAFAIRDAFFPDTPIDYLFASDGDVPSEREKDMAQLDALEEILDGIDADPVLYETLDEMRGRHG